MNDSFRPGAIAVCLALWFFSSGSPCVAEVLRIRPGFQQILDIPGVTRISVGNPEIVEARPLTRRDGVLVVGKKEGDTDLVIWEKAKRIDWSVEVRNRKPSPGDEARAFAAAFPDLAVNETGTSVVIGYPPRIHAPRPPSRTRMSGCPSISWMTQYPYIAYWARPA